jgi:glycosyltransferase involved in cell wall biosynthesis
VPAKPHLLFISHSASRNGATILLLDILRWLRREDKFRLEVLVCGRGELLDDFRAIAPTRVWRSPASLLGILPPRLQRAWQPKIESLALKLFFFGRAYDLAYLNTSALWPFVPALTHRARRLLWHIHELEYALRLTLGNADATRIFPAISRFIVVSQPVREVLQNNYAVPSDRIDLVHGFVSPHNYSAAERTTVRQRILHSLGWPEDSYVVGGCGTLGWRKGTDLFVQLARAMCLAPGGPPVRFLWVGGTARGDEALRLAHDIKHGLIADVCTQVPSTADVADYYHVMDVLALTSREDPFPLVMLEAGASRVPTVCFADSGGAVEYVGEDAGLVAPFLDLRAFAGHLETLQRHPELRQRLGEAAERKVRARYTVATQGPLISASISRCQADPG